MIAKQLNKTAYNESAKTNTVDNKYMMENGKKSLIGVSVGDAFGDSFFGETDEILKKIASREIPIYSHREMVLVLGRQKRLFQC